MMRVSVYSRRFLAYLISGMTSYGAASRNRRPSARKSFTSTNVSRECRPKLTAFKKNDAEHLADLVGRRNALSARRGAVEQIVISTDLPDDQLRNCFEQMKAFDAEVAQLNQLIADIQAALLDY